jgi:uncharacterized protein (TIGR02246 family)
MHPRIAAAALALASLAASAAAAKGKPAAPTYKASAAVEKAVDAVLAKFTEAYAKKDAAAVMALMSASPAGVLIGTGADEKRFGPDEAKAQLERDFGQVDSAKLELANRRVAAKGDVAWVYADGAVTVTVKGQSQTLGGLRLTGLLIKEGGKWRFAQTHFSAPLQEQKEGASFPEAKPDSAKAADAPPAADAPKKDEPPADAPKKEESSGGTPEPPKQ